MEWVETTGSSITEALDAALDQLGVDEQEAEIQILDEPQKGLFGRLKVEARVRARVRPTAPRAKVDRRDRRRRGENRRGKKGSRSGPGTKSGAKSGAPKARSADAKPADAGSASGTDNGQSAAKQSADENDKTDASTMTGSSTGQSSGSRRRRRRGGGGGGSQQGGNVSGTTTTAEAGSPMDVEAQRKAVDEFLTGLMEAFGRSDAEVSTTTDEDATIVAEVQGSELGLLVGPRGLTLQALHELTRSMVQRQFVGESHARLQLDVAGYRKRRTEALERFTQKIADEVLASGRAKALDPMPASDRKVVHDVINTLDGVRTKSEGEEPRRRVVIERD